MGRGVVETSDLSSLVHKGFPRIPVIIARWKSGSGTTWKRIHSTFSKKYYTRLHVPWGTIKNHKRTFNCLFLGTACASIKFYCRRGSFLLSATQRLEFRHGLIDLIWFVFSKLSGIVMQCKSHDERRPSDWHLYNVYAGNIWLFLGHHQSYMYMSKTLEFLIIVTLRINLGLKASCNTFNFDFVSSECDVYSNGLFICLRSSICGVKSHFLKVAQ